MLNKNGTLNDVQLSLFYGVQLSLFNSLEDGITKVQLVPNPYEGIKATLERAGNPDSLGEPQDSKRKKDSEDDNN